MQSNAQFLEFGGGLGGLNYSGDLTRGLQISEISPGITLHHRMNFSNFFSVKFSGTYGGLKGSDEDPFDAFGAVRDQSFKIRIFEAASVLEYHFLDYKHEKSLIRWSPYAFIGMGFTRLLRTGEKSENYNQFQAVIPMGLGFNHLIGKKFSLGFEFGFRTTFTDYLDNISRGDKYIKDYQYGNVADRDFYTFISFSISYILYKIPCPFPYVPNKSMLRR